MAGGYARIGLRLIKALPYLLVAVAIAAAVPRLGNLEDLTSDFTERLFAPDILLSVVPLALLSYGLRVLRWIILARRIDPEASPAAGALSQIAGFAFSLSPGRLAEVYKLHFLDRGDGAPFSRGIAAIVVERITDVLGFGFMVAVGVTGSIGATALLGRLSIWSLAVGLAVAAAVWGSGQLLARTRWPKAGATWARDWVCRQRLGQSAVLRRVLPTIHQLQVGGRQVSSPAVLLAATGCVCLGRLGDGIVLWKMASAVGFPIPFVVACLVVGSTGLAGGISLSPGGVGTAEAALSALLVVHGLPVSGAIVVALGSRALSYWIWVGVGAVVLAVWRPWNRDQPLAYRPAAILASTDSERRP